MIELMVEKPMVPKNEKETNVSWTLSSAKTEN